MNPLTISILFLALAVTLFAIDLVLPSAGILLALSLISAIAADLFAFRANYNIGLWMLIVELASIPLGAWLFAKWWAKTPIGKRMIIQPSVAQAFDWEVKKLVGKKGIAIDDFLPTGRIEIEGKFFDAIGRGETIVKGQEVVVIGEEMGQLFVLPCSNLEDVFLNSDPSKQSKNNQTQSIAPLDKPATDLGIQTLD